MKYLLWIDFLTALKCLRHDELFPNFNVQKSIATCHNICLTTITMKQGCFASNKRNCQCEPLLLLHLQWFAWPWLYYQEVTSKQYHSGSKSNLIWDISEILSMNHRIIQTYKSLPYLIDLSSSNDNSGETWGVAYYQTPESNDKYKTKIYQCPNSFRRSRC